MRALLVVALLGLFMASPVRGDHPTPADSDVPCGIILVGTTAGVPDALGEFNIVIRDLSHNPVADANVYIDFGNCTPDIRVSMDQPFPPGSSVSCTAGRMIIGAKTDANGTIIYRLVGSANHHASGDPGVGFKCASVYWEDQPLGFINVATFDQDGAGGVGPVDISLWLTDSYSPTFEGRSDYNCSNTINPVDLSMLLTASLGSGSLNSATNYCQ